MPLLVQTQTCIGPTLHQYSTNFWDLPDRCLFNIHCSLLFCKCTKLKQQYVPYNICYSGIIVRKGPNYCPPPLLSVARSHAMGAGVCFNDVTASLYCVRFYTHNPWNVIVLYLPLWEHELFHKSFFMQAMGVSHFSWTIIVQTEVDINHLM